jgi:hypothetical protein
MSFPPVGTGPRCTVETAERIDLHRNCGKATSGLVVAILVASSRGVRCLLVSAQFNQAPLRKRSRT